MNEHQEMLKSTFNEVLIQEIVKRLKKPTLNEIDLIMYFGDAEDRLRMKAKILPELVRKMHIIDLIRLSDNLNLFIEDFWHSWYLVNEEIKTRRKMVEL